MEKEQIIEMLLKRIDIKGLLVEDFLVGFLFKKIDEKVASTDATWDDGLAAMLKPVLESAAAEFLDEKIKKEE